MQDLQEKLISKATLVGSRGRALMYGRPEPEGRDYDYVITEGNSARRRNIKKQLKKLVKSNDDFKYLNRPHLDGATASSGNIDISVYKPEHKARIHESWRLQEQGIPKAEAWDIVNKTGVGMTKTASNETYRLHISGEKVQNVGLRKNLHRILDEHGMDGVAVNNPYNDTVEAYISGSEGDRRKVVSKLSDYIQESTGHPITVKEHLSSKKMRPITMNREQMEDVTNGQYLAYMLTSGDDRRNDSDVGIAKAEAALMPRFRLKKEKNGLYSGMLPEMGIKQLTGKAPHYKKFMKHNHKIGIDEGISNMAPADRAVVRAGIRRLGSKSITG